MVFIACTPSAVGNTRAAICMACGNTVTGTTMPPKNPIAMPNTWVIAPMLTTRTVNAMMSSA